MSGWAGPITTSAQGSIPPGGWVAQKGTGSIIIIPNSSTSRTVTFDPCFFSTFRATFFETITNPRISPSRWQG